MDEGSLRLELLVYGRFRIPRHWRFFFEAPSVFFTTDLHPLGLALEFFLHERVHDLEPGLWGLLVWVLRLPFFLVPFPFLVDMWFPFTFIGQCVIRLPCLKHSWLCGDLKQTTRPRIGDQGTCTVVKPLSHALCRSLVMSFLLQ